MRTVEIENVLEKALIQGEEMAYALYEYDLEEHIDYWYEGLVRDNEEFVFAVNENSGNVAMILITTDKTLYINEKAREKLQEIWSETYNANIKRLIPRMADELANDIIVVNGVKTTRT